jgi:tRNA1Val (adenine37-N6)-methyltransferase
MKIGTDGVLLGAWCPLENEPESILDIGTGTGIIGLMLAQRSDAFTIDAVEMDENAYEQAVENFEASDWGDRLYCYHATFQEFATEINEEEETYDLIVSNPPFYTDEFKTENESRNNARFETFLPFEELLKSVVKILSKNGIFTLILPFKEEENFITLAEKNKLFPKRICHVQGNATSPIKRSLLAFSFQKDTIVKEQLIIEKERHVYTKDYIHLTKDFYLKM